MIFLYTLSIYAKPISPNKLNLLNVKIDYIRESKITEDNLELQRQKVLKSL